MIDEAALQELLSYSSSSPILSVYLDLDPQQATPDAPRQRLRQLLRDFEAEAPDDTQAVARHFELAHDQRGRSLAMFSQQADGFFRAFPLAVALRSRARRMDRPYVKPFAEFFQAGRARRILLGGHPTTTTPFRNLLPKTWQSLIIGEFPIDMDAGHAEILQRAMAIAEP